MRTSSVLSVLLLAGSVLAARADVIPYNNPGTVPPTVPLTATVTGNITGYFYASEAGGSDYVRLVDVTSGYVSQYMLDNHGNAPGGSADFGQVNAGDTLVFELVNSDVETNKDGTDWGNKAPFYPNAQANSYIMASDPAYSVDGVNHAYVTSFSGDANIPAGVFLGMEDLPFGAADKDYNDTEFVFTDVSTAAVTPEPGSVVLLGTGALGLMGAMRRRRSA